LIGTLVTIGITVAFLAVLYDLTFLSEYLRARPQDGPGYEHLLFSVLANVLIAMCAFVSVVLFFRSRSLLQKPLVAQQRPRASVGDADRSLESDFNRPQPALRSLDEPTAQR